MNTIAIIIIFLLLWRWFNNQRNAQKSSLPEESSQKRTDLPELSVPLYPISAKFPSLTTLSGKPSNDISSWLLNNHKSYCQPVDILRIRERNSQSFSRPSINYDMFLSPSSQLGRLNLDVLNSSALTTDLDDIPDYDD